MEEVLEEKMKPVPNQLPSSDPGPLRLALVGEAPGESEVAEGRPFCGPSGWKLDGWLATAGISRSQVFVGNVSQCRPSPKSNEFHLLDWNGPQVQEGIAALREDLARFRPNIVVALGNAAIHLLRHGNVAPPKSQKLQLFQWSSHIGTWRGSLFLGASDFDAFRAADLRTQETQRGLSICERPGINGLISPTVPGSNATSESNANQADYDVKAASVASSVLANAGELNRQVQAGERPATLLVGGERHESVGVTAPREARGITPPTISCGEANGAGACIAGLTPERASLPTPLSAGCGAANYAALSGESPGSGPAAPFKCLATYHPAATFREPSFVYPLVSDLKRAVAEARSPLLVLPQRDIRWGLSADDIEARCAAIRAARAPVGFDIEGGLGGLQCASFATSPASAFVVDLMDPTLDRPRLLTAIFSVLEDASVPKVCWNAAYERAILQATHSVTMRNYEDGMLAWWERFSELPKGLDFVASILTREPYWAEGIGWDKRTGLPKVTGPRFWLYNGRDSCTTIEIWQHPIIKAVVESRTPVPFEL